MKTPIILWSYLVSVSFFLLSCSMAVQVHKEPIYLAEDVAKHAVYGWGDGISKKISQPEVTSREFDSILHRAMTLKLSEKGYEEQRKKEPDFFVDYRLTLTTTQIELLDLDTTVVTSDVISNRSKSSNFPIQDRKLISTASLSADETIKILQQARIHIGAFDLDGKLLWHAYADKLVEPHHKRNEHEAILQGMVNRLMAEFPLQRKKAQLRKSRDGNIS